jgi:hypothetical protein
MNEALAHLKKGREEEKTGEEVSGRIWQKGYRRWSYL